MEILSILFGFFEEKDGGRILKIIGILFQYFFNISVPSIVLCIQCNKLFQLKCGVVDYSSGSAWLPIQATVTANGHCVACWVTNLAVTVNPPVASLHVRTVYVWFL